MTKKPLPRTLASQFLPSPGELADDLCFQVVTAKSVSNSIVMIAAPLRELRAGLPYPIVIA